MPKILFDNNAESLSPAQRQQLETYQTLLEFWNKKINLLSRQQDLTGANFWQRHIGDSLYLAKVIRQDKQLMPNNYFMDLGSGGGLPAIPMAIILQKPVVMVESHEKKSIFLREVLRQLALTGWVCQMRIEQLTAIQLCDIMIGSAQSADGCQQSCDFVTARALKSIPELLPLVTPLWASLFGQGKVAESKNSMEQISEYTKAKYKHHQQPPLYLLKGKNSIKEMQNFKKIINEKTFIDKTWQLQLLVNNNQTGGVVIRADYSINNHINFKKTIKNNDLQ